VKTGKQWMEELQGSLVHVVRYMALDRYGAVPDIADRVGDALAALVEGSERFEPQEGKDSLGYFLQYVLTYVAGALRNGAKSAKTEAANETCLTDLTPDLLGIEAVWESIPASPDQEPEETLFVTKSGKVASKLELVAMASDEAHGPFVSRLLGVQVDDPQFEVQFLQVLDKVEDMLTAEPRWLEEVPEPEPVVNHDLDDIVVTTNGVQSMITGAEMRDLVIAASRGNATWIGEGEEDSQDDDDTPWATHLAADGMRAWETATADENTWPTVVSKQVWKDTVDAWATIGWAGDVLDILDGTAPESGEPRITTAVVSLEILGDVLLDEPDGSTRIVARALANRLHANGVIIGHEDDQTAQDALFERICWLWNVDGSSEWEAALPSAESLRAPVKAWFDITAKARGVWPSQAAAVGAVVLHGDSPAEATTAARATFAAAHSA